MKYPDFELFYFKLIQKSKLIKNSGEKAKESGGRIF